MASGNLIKLKHILLSGVDKNSSEFDLDTSREKEPDIPNTEGEEAHTEGEEAHTSED